MVQRHANATVGLPGRVSDARYWLIVRESFARADVFSINRRGGGAVLPVFSSEEEAQRFSGKDYMESCWRAQPIEVGDLVSLLYAYSTQVECVALDPAWEMLTERALDLVSLSRESFVLSLLGGDHSSFEEWSRTPNRRERGISATAYGGSIAGIPGCIR